MAELLEKDAKKCHAEYGRHLEFLRKKIYTKVKYLNNMQSKKKRRFIGFRNKSYFGGHIELSGHFKLWSFKIFFLFFSSPKSIKTHN
jgi:hypothetical protein